jgi:hypothetical protein
VRRLQATLLALSATFVVLTGSQHVEHAVPQHAPTVIAAPDSMDADHSKIWG